MHRSYCERNAKPKAFLLSIAFVGSLAPTQAPAAEQATTQKAVLKPGTYAHGPAKHPHMGYCASASPCILFIAFESPLDAVPVEPAKKS